MIEIINEPTIEFVAGLGWGALLYETLQIVGRYYLIRKAGIKLTNDQKIDMVDDGKINDSIASEEDQ